MEAIRTVNPALLSKERKFVFGVATIMILLVHCITYIPSTNIFFSIVAKCCQYGSLGVPIFAFLSGIGIFYSLTNNKPKTYFRNRINRTFIPFFVMAFIACGYFYLVLDWEPIIFVEEITTLSFWLNHHGPWYIAMLVPLYLVSPIYYKSRIGG